MSTDTAPDPDLAEAIKRGLVKPVAEPDDPDLREALKRGLVQRNGPQFEATKGGATTLQDIAASPWIRPLGDGPKPDIVGARQRMEEREAGEEARIRAKLDEGLRYPTGPSRDMERARRFAQLPPHESALLLRRQGKPKMSDFTTEQRREIIERENEERMRRTEPTWMSVLRVPVEGGKAVPRAIGGGLKTAFTGDTVAERVGGVAQAGFNVIPMVAGLTTAFGAREEAGAADRAMGGTGESKFDVGMYPVTKPGEWGGKAGEIIGRNVAFDQSPEGRAAGGKSGHVFGEIGGQLLAAKGASLGAKAWMKSPSGKSFMESMNRERAPASVAIQGPVSLGATEYGAERLPGKRAAVEPQRGPIRVQPSELVSADEIARFRAEVRAAEMDAAGGVPLSLPRDVGLPRLSGQDAIDARGVDPYTGEPVRTLRPGEGSLPARRSGDVVPEPTPQTHPELFDADGFRRTRIGRAQGDDVQWLGSGGGNLDPASLGAVVGRGLRVVDRLTGRVKGGSLGGATLGAGAAGEITVPEAKGGSLGRNIESFRNEFGKGGQRLADTLGTIESAARAQIGDLRKGIEAEYNNLGIRQRMAVHESLDQWVSGEVPTPSWAQGVVREVRASMKRQPEQYENPSGVRITEETPQGRVVRPVPSDNPNYVPGGGTHDSIKAIIKENIDNKALIERGDYTGSPLTEAWMKKNSKNPWTPEEMQRQVRNGPQQHGTEFIESMFAGAERAREFRWPREMQNPDKLDLYFNRISRGAYNAAEHSPETGFGYRYETKSGDTIKTPGRFGEILDQIESEGLSRETAKNRALRILRRDPHGRMREGWRLAQQVEGLYTTASKLSGSLAQIPQQLGQIGNQFIEGGIRPVTLGARNVARNPRQAIRDARARGDIQPDNYLQSMDLMQEGAGGVPIRVARGVVKATQAPQQLLDTTSRAVASEGASAQLAKVTESYRRGGVGNRLVGRDASWADRALLRLDLPMADRLAIKTAALKGGEIPADAAARFRQAYTRYTNNEAGIPEFPRVFGEMGSDPRLMWARRFMAWSTSQARFFKESVADEAVRGNVAPLARATIATLIVGEAVNKTRDFQGYVTGREVDRDDIRDIIKNRDFDALKARVLQDITAAGTMGMWTSAAKNTTEGRVGLPPVVMTIFGPNGLIRSAWDSVASDKEASDIWWRLFEKEFPQANRWMGEPRKAEAEDKKRAKATLNAVGR